MPSYPGYFEEGRPDKKTRSRKNRRKKTTMTNNTTSYAFTRTFSSLNERKKPILRVGEEEPALDSLIDQRGSDTALGFDFFGSTISTDIKSRTGALFDISPETRAARRKTNSPSLTVPRLSGPKRGHRQPEQGQHLPSPRTRTLLTFKKLISCLMKNGKRGSVERMLFQCCAFIKMKNKTASRRFIYQAVHNAKPLIELRNLRKANKGSRRQKAKAAPIPTLRSEKLAIQ